MIIFPQVINNDITDVKIKVKVKSLSKKYNIVVIVPSHQRSSFWDDIADLILDYSNINDGVYKLKNGHVGLVIFINKYDGVDLPDSACRILVIDGLPTMRNEYDSFFQNVNPSSKRLLSEQVQKIEQGMGRGVRSNNDYCVTVLMGKGLSDIIFRADGYNFFSKATQKQLELSRLLWEQLREINSKPTINEIFSLTDYLLNRNIDWIKASKDALATIKYEKAPHIDDVSIVLRNAFEKIEIRQYKEAVGIIESLKNTITDEKTKGFLMQTIAEYTNLINEEEAQQILISAIKFNKGLIRPIDGIQHQRLVNKLSIQAQTLINYINNEKIDHNGYILKVNSLLESLEFSQDTSKRFEATINDISFILGIESSRPEFEHGKGPDNLWAVGDNNYLVIECKNETISKTINKHDCNQLNGSIVWFENEYRGTGFMCTPIMIHNSNVFEHACSPSSKIRIMLKKHLLLFKKNIKYFANYLVFPDNYKNIKKIDELLFQYKLLGSMIVNEYTTGFRVK